MSFKISPAPFNDPPGTFAWLEWFRQLREAVNHVPHYGVFSSDADQTLSAADTATAVTFNTQPVANGINLVDNTKIVIPNTGTYSFTFTAQVLSSSASAKNVWFWPRINGVDIPGFTMKHTLAANAETKVVTRGGVFRLNINDYLEAYWAADSTDISLDASAATAFAPASPSVILSVTQVD